MRRALATRPGSRAGGGAAHGRAAWAARIQASTPPNQRKPPRAVTGRERADARRGGDLATLLDAERQVEVLQHVKVAGLLRALEPRLNARTDAVARSHENAVHM